MAITVNLYTAFDVLLDSGQVIKGGSRTTPQTISCDSEIMFDRTYSIAATTLTEIWNDSMLATFDFLAIISDTAGEIQILAGEDATGEVGMVLPMAANVWQVFAAGDASKRNFTIDTWESTGTADDIDRVEWYHASGTAIVRVLAIT